MTLWGVKGVIEEEGGTDTGIHTGGGEMGDFPPFENPSPF